MNFCLPQIVDYLFYLFHIGMLIWNYTLWVRKDSKLGAFVDTCNDAANFFADCYRYLGYFFAAVLFIGIFALVCSKIRPKPKLEEMTYGDDVPDYSNGRALNPYGNINRGPAGDGKPNPAAK